METKNKNPFEIEAMKMARRLLKHESTVEFVLKNLDTHFRESLSIEQKKQICTEAIVLNLANAPESEIDKLEQTKLSLEKCQADMAELILECGLGEMNELSYFHNVQKHITGALKQITELENSF